MVTLNKISIPRVFKPGLNYLQQSRFCVFFFIGTWFKVVCQEEKNNSIISLFSHFHKSNHRLCLIFFRLLSKT